MTLRSYFLRYILFDIGLICSLALAIGGNAAVFSLLQAVILNPLPYDRPEELVMLWRSGASSIEIDRSLVTPRYLLGFRNHAGDVVKIAGVKSLGALETQIDLETTDGTERLQGAFATPNVFELLGVRAAYGRTFVASDELSGSVEPIVISHRLWMRSFGGDPRVINQAIVLTAGRGPERKKGLFSILGVLPAVMRFNYPNEIEVWVLRRWSAIANENQDATGYQVIGRLRQGVSIRQAAAKLAVSDEAIQPQPVDLPIESRTTTRVESIDEWVIGEAKAAMSLLALVALLILLASCTTAASALFARARERRHELTVRAVLGASRSRLIRQLVGEGALLAAVSAIAGIALAIVLMPALRLAVPQTIPRGDEIRVDWALGLFGIATTVIVTVLSAVAPALRGSRVDSLTELKLGAVSITADVSTSIWRSSLLGLQALIAATLAVLSTLLVVSFWNLAHLPLGFQVSDAITVQMRILESSLLDDNRIREVQRALIVRLSMIPGVRSVGMTSAVPFRGVDWRVQLQIPNDPRASTTARLRQVDPAYFAILKHKLVVGRLFDERDTSATADVAIMSESLARGMFGPLSPLGKQIRGVRPGSSSMTVVGIVSDVRYRVLTNEPEPAIYVPREQYPSELICLLIDAGNGSAASFIPAIRKAVRDVEPRLPSARIGTIRELMAETTQERWFYTVVTSSFGALAVLLTVGGLANITARNIVEQRRQLAIRAALGATNSRLFARILLQGMLPVVAGMLAGLLLTAGYLSSLVPFIFGVSARDPVVYLSIAVLLIWASGLSGYLAARALLRVPVARILRS